MISSTTTNNNNKSKKQGPKNISSKRGTKKKVVGNINYLDIIVFGSVLFVAIFLISCSLILHGLNAGNDKVIDNNDELSDVNSDHHHHHHDSNSVIQEKIDHINNNKNLRIASSDGITTNNNGNQNQNHKDHEEEQEEYVILKTDLAGGIIKIRLLPNLSPDSVEHVQSIARRLCAPCKMYRAEKKLLLQGIMKNNEIVTKPTKGECPPEYLEKKQNCPDYDPNCACHGPTMTKGMVGWAGGGTGPDFFINVFEKPVDFWGQQHTVWGIVEDLESLTFIEKTILEDQPVHKGGNMFRLDTEIHFTMSL